jgi:hypothetical protein
MAGSEDEQFIYTINKCKCMAWIVMIPDDVSPDAVGEEYWSVPQYDPTKIRMLQLKLEQRGKCELLRGLDALELAALESKFQFQFPPELVAFLSVGVPVDPPQPTHTDVTCPAEERASPFGWHNWHWLLRPDVPRHSWTSPDDAEDQRDTVTCQLRWHAPPDPEDSDDEYRGELSDAAPECATEKRIWKDAMRRRALQAHPLIPLRGHRMMPTVSYGQTVPPVRFPVFSLHGNDCVHYGTSLWAWLALEFPDVDIESCVPPQWHRNVRAAELGLYEHWACYVDGTE